MWLNLAWSLVNDCDGSPDSVNSVIHVLDRIVPNDAFDEYDDLMDALAFKSREFYRGF